MGIDQYLLSSVLNADHDGRVQLDQDVRVKLLSLLDASGDESNQERLHRLREFLRYNQSIAATIANVVVENAFIFLDEELDKYEKIKAVRPLTQEEKQYGTVVLPELVRSVTSLFAEGN